MRGTPRCRVQEQALVGVSIRFVIDVGKLLPFECPIAAWLNIVVNSEELLSCDAKSACQKNVSQPLSSCWRARVLEALVPSVQIHDFSSGEPALKHVEAQGADLVITDCNMPG